MPDVFLSYNREDQTIARQIAEALGASDLDVWWDTTLKAGQAYDDVTERALRDAKAVVVLWTPRSVASRWVRAEATLANRLGTLVPIMIEACERPILFELVQTPDLTNWDGTLQDAAWLSFLADLHEQITSTTPPATATLPTNTTETRASHFGSFSLLPDRRALIRSGVPVEVPADAFDLLRILIRERAEPRTRAELSEYLHQGGAVDHAAIAGHVNRLRKILGPNVIRTIPGQGYQFVAELREQGAKEICSAPPDHVSQPRQTNLPASLPELYGRGKEVAELVGLITEQGLVTICGPGGMGKSSVGRAVAAQLVDTFEDGVWWVELAELSSGHLVVPGIARALDISLSSPNDIQELSDHLGDRHVLLILDNCEHLVDDVAGVVSTLIEHAPDLHVLATSQEIIRLPCEHVYRLEPLGVSDEGTPDGVDASGAVALFEARAREVADEFRLTDDNRPKVADICMRLDGLPLAIELAAARLPLLGLSGLHQRLNDRFRLLAGKSRTTPTRQRTLRAALEWSYGLLSGDERTVYQRLGVFVGDFDLEAAEQVCSGDGLDPWDVMDHVEALVDKSLLTTISGALPRYRLLDTPRTFALEKLEESGNAPHVYRRHAECMLARLLEAQDNEWELSGAQTSARAVADIANIRAALHWASSKDGDDGLLVDLAGTGSIVWRLAKAEGEGLSWAQKALKVVNDSTPPNAEAELLVSFALMSHQRDADRETSALSRAASLFESMGDSQKQYFALGTLAKKLIWKRDLDQAERIIEQAEALFIPSWQPAVREPVLQARTYLLEILGRPEEGEPLMLELVDIMRAVGDPERIDTALLELAENYIVQGKYEDAASVHQEVMSRTRKRGAPYIPSNLGNLAGALTQLDRIDEALDMARLAIPLLQRQQRLAVFLDHFALLSCKRGHLEDAALICGRADAVTSASGFEREVSEATARAAVQEALVSKLETARLNALFEQGKLVANADAAQLAVRD